MSKEAEEYIRYNEKMNSSLCTDWSKKMIVESHEVYHQSQLQKLKERADYLIEEVFKINGVMTNNHQASMFDEKRGAKWLRDQILKDDNI